MESFGSGFVMGFAVGVILAVASYFSGLRQGAIEGKKEARAQDMWQAQLEAGRLRRERDAAVQQLEISQQPPSRRKRPPQEGEQIRGGKQEGKR